MKKINKSELHGIFQNLRKRDQNAYNKLYEKYYNLIYSIVFSIIKNNHDSEDITHEIFTKIYNLDANKLPTNNESSWLFTVSKNECYLYLRKMKPNINIDEIYEIPETNNDIDKVIDTEYYNKLIKGLKEDEKLIVSLKVLSNLTFSKISKIMNIPIGTVQWKYYNAINSLKVSVSSLVGAIVAFIIVVARGEMLKSKMYLNKNNEVGNSEHEDGRRPSEDSSVSNEEGNASSKEDIENIEQDQNQNENTEQDKHQNENQNQDQNQNENQDINQEINSDNNQTNNITQTDKNEQYIENNKQETIQQTTTSSQSKTNKLDTVQMIFIAVGITFLIIFIIFFKIYQQKLRKKSSK